MHTIQTHKGEIIVVEVEFESTAFDIFKRIPEGCEIIGTCTKGELDFNCEPYVEGSEVKNTWFYKDYSNPKAFCRNPTDCFLSLLTSQKVEYANKKLVFLKREK